MLTSRQLYANLNASATSHLAVVFSCLKRLVEPVVSDAIDTQVRFYHRPAFSEDDDLWDERYGNHIVVQLGRQPCGLTDLLAVQQPEPANHHHVGSSSTGKKSSNRHHILATTNYCMSSFNDSTIGYRRWAVHTTIDAKIRRKGFPHISTKSLELSTPRR